MPVTPTQSADHQAQFARRPTEVRSIMDDPGLRELTQRPLPQLRAGEREVGARDRQGSDQQRPDKIHTVPLPPTPALVEPTPQEAPQLNGASNRPRDLKFTLVYVNGLSTSRPDAEAVSQIVRRNLGIPTCDVRLIYNKPEMYAVGLGKVVGGLVSGRLGRQCEPECSMELRDVACTALKNPNERVIFVGASHASIVIQNTFDGLHDEFTRANGSQWWRNSAARCEVIFYAPLVYEMVPGLRVTGFTNSLDVPARGAGNFSSMVTWAKRSSGYRPYEPFDSVCYSPSSNRFPDLILNPGGVHCCLDLALQDCEFNLQRLGREPKTGKLDGSRLALRLAESIREGWRSDMLHTNLIYVAVKKCGASFAVPFIKQLTLSLKPRTASIGYFKIDEALLDLLLHTANRR